MREFSYVFTAPMPGGPWRRVFTCPSAFGAYVQNWRDECGPVDWPTPFLARGAL